MFSDTSFVYLCLGCHCAQVPFKVFQWGVIVTALISSQWQHNPDLICLIVLPITLACSLSILLSIVVPIFGRCQFFSSMSICRSTAVVSQQGWRILSTHTRMNTHTVSHNVIETDNEQICHDTRICVPQATKENKKYTYV